MTPDPNLQTASELGAEIVVGLLAVLFIMAVVVFALLRAARHPPPVSLIVSLSLLSTIALITFALTELAVLGTIAATGIGALAGAVSAVLGVPKKEDPDQKEEDGDAA